MWHVGRDVDEVTRARVGDELQLLVPAHARLAADDVDDALERAVGVRPGLGPGLDDSGPSPESLRACAGAVDGGRAVHAEGLWRVGVELVRVDDTYAVVLPPWIVGSHWGHLLVRLADLCAAP